MCARLLEHLEKSQGRQTFRDKQRRPQFLFEIYLRSRQASCQQFFRMDNPDNVVESALRNRESRVERRSELVLVLFERIVQIQPHDVTSGPHEGINSPITQFEDTL